MPQTPPEPDHLTAAREAVSRLDQLPRDLEVFAGTFDIISLDHLVGETDAALQALRIHATIDENAAAGAADATESKGRRPASRWNPFRRGLKARPA